MGLTNTNVSICASRGKPIVQNEWVDSYVCPSYRNVMWLIVRGANIQHTDPAVVQILTGQILDGCVV